MMEDFSFENKILTELEVMSALKITRLKLVADNTDRQHISDVLRACKVDPWDDRKVGELVAGLALGLLQLEGIIYAKNGLLRVDEFMEVD